MTGRGPRIVGFLAVLFGLLLAGRFLTTLLADRWWAAGISPAAVAFLTQWHLLRLTLEVAAVAVASAWFVGHLLVVYRAIGSVQVPRRVANLEIREAMTPRTLLLLVVTAGVVAGIAAGAGAADWWSTVALAWQGVTFGVVDPLLRRDLGLYVAQLPLWRQLHEWTLVLVAVALIGVLALYLLIGSVRWIEGRPAVSDHARAHLGWLLAALALALGWGYLLEPYELVAGIDPAADAAPVRVVVAHTLAGTALTVALLSALWALRPRHALVLAGWVVLALTSVVGHHILPGLAADGARPVEPAAARRLERLAFGLDSLDQRSFSADPAAPEPYRPASLWHPEVLRRLLPVPAETLLYAEPVPLRLGDRPRPAWLLLRGAGAVTRVSAIADDTVGGLGLALSYRAGDSIAAPGLATLLALPPHAVRPGAPEYVLTPGGPHGVPAGSPSRRITLAWARQAAPLLGNLPPDARLSWHLDPGERLARLAPFAVWGRPAARLIGNRLVWISDGHVTAAHFPLVQRLDWGGREVGLFRVGFVGTVVAETGETHVYLRDDAGPIARSWAALAGGVVEPAALLPAAVRRVMGYPADLFRVQSRVVERAWYGAGRLVARADTLRANTGPRAGTFAWEAGASAPTAVAVYEAEAAPRIAALLVGRRVDGRDRLVLVRIDSTRSLPSPARLQEGWDRFPSFEKIQDSVTAAGGSWRSGPVRYWLGREGLGAYQPGFAVDPDGGASLAWVSVASGERRGAARTLADGWRNLEGAVAPPIAGGARPARLQEARRWLRRADSALLRGDWAEFGRAYDALHRVLELPPPERP
ncbi:MAG TPA: UPF0182 family protein [Gemmatimonadales bacterium]|nr:UPF0182 family protein [Gemmatimonadales bacterium]